jgi:hypothetical protein
MARRAVVGAVGCGLALAVAAGTPGAALAQPPPRGGQAPPPTEEITFTPEPEDTIVVDRRGLADRLDRLEAKLRDADAAVMDYLRDSSGAVQQGHARGLDEFKVWFRRWQNAREASSTALVEGIVKALFSSSLDFVFPEASAFVKTLKKLSEQALSTGLAAMRPSSGDVNAFLDEIARVEGRHIEALQSLPQTFRTDNPGVFENAKWEYVWSVRETSVLPPEAKNYLSAVGVPPPGADTIRRVKEEILTGHIEMVYRSNEMTMRGLGPYSVRAMAQMDALQQIDPAGNRDRICQIARSNFNAFFWPSYCRS